ncbi:imidazole glycerol phosphate synthase subunit HisH [Deferribacterales bacterium Es71-Z0220]|jgi:glutamine amidotransferase|uniref:imidazole glycerol phosphate synthase subunit HisH n=1 Tax=Deferrivibrio essentukiensis TaxID=2880922 RepID=UPI001F60651D|nr:imidazole glycerol phosphate synthase subunit HisH [Deferrivibrio essentukiensis]MBZ4672438.1 imidazole glycerol phosphate synthase subunit hisH [Deferribacteraceae bacterium]MCB4205401.1 imidazole glycerol phosphate synthase subunit HisH [Deferrivibrio essentukiensis]
MIIVIDYGMGNLQSVNNALLSLGFDSKISSDPDDLKVADKVILPGVGAFKDCYDGLEKSGFIGPIYDFINTGKPFLGICVGMQLLFEKSYEFGEHKGLKLLKGEVVKFPDSIVDKGMKIPHMGWNNVKNIKSGSFFDCVPDDTFVYFVHSFYAPVVESTVLSCEYGVQFSAAVEKGNVLGVQFHPEKSQDAGLNILRKFGEM